MSTYVYPYEIRALKNTDFDIGFLKLLDQLSDTGNISRKIFEQAVNQLSKDKVILVFVRTDYNIIIGTGSLFIEQKMSHSCSSVGHIEDIVVDSQHRHRGHAKKILESLIQIARVNNCYKVILSCKTENIPVYRNLGFTEEETTMSLRF